MIDTFIAAWRTSIDDLVALLEQLEPEEWDRPSVLPGWRVRDVAAHVAHLESVLAGHDRGPELDTEAGAEAFVASDYTQLGVAARADHEPSQIIDEIRRAAGARMEQLREAPPADGRPPVTPGGVDWTWEVLLRNRVVDVWTHEQDIRLSVDRPGSEATPGAHITVIGLSMAMPFVLGRKVGAPSGVSARWVLTGPVETTVTALVGDDGRARPAEVENPDVTLTMSSPVFAQLATGRRGPGEVLVDVEGGAELAAQLLEAMNILF